MEILLCCVAFGVLVWLVIHFISEWLKNHIEDACYEYHKDYVDKWRFEELSKLVAQEFDNHDNILRNIEKRILILENKVDKDSLYSNLVEDNDKEIKE